MARLLNGSNGHNSSLTAFPLQRATASVKGRNYIQTAMRMEPRFARFINAEWTGKDFVVNFLFTFPGRPEQSEAFPVRFQNERHFADFVERNYLRELAEQRKKNWRKK